MGLCGAHVWPVRLSSPSAVLSLPSKADSCPCPSKADSCPCSCLVVANAVWWILQEADSLCACQDNCVGSKRAAETATWAVSAAGLAARSFAKLVASCMMLPWNERDGRLGPPAGNKARCNRTNTPHSKAMQRKAKPNQTPQTYTRGARQASTILAEGRARPRIGVRPAARIATHAPDRPTRPPWTHARFNGQPRPRLTTQSENFYKCKHKRQQRNETYSLVIFHLVACEMVQIVHVRVATVRFATTTQLFPFARSMMFGARYCVYSLLLGRVQGSMVQIQGLQMTGLRLQHVGPVATRTCTI
jgi:hypothetical protein